ncbi:MAG: ribonuclease H-like domain-containing protein [Lachnospiraceae bacterium]|nr:ribonuclease H-like domain-containing protein [Lachnospiraceae bacterium]
MQTIQKTLDGVSVTYPLDEICPLDKVLFLDIETTGFTAKNAILYLIGCVYYQDERWHTIQWFADTRSSEKEVIESFLNFSKNYQYLIHFNGNHFDIPFIEEKCREHGLASSLTSFKGIDLYQRTSAIKGFLGLMNCKQKTVEEFLGIDRNDPFDGGQLISMYHEYTRQPDGEKFCFIIGHNADDIAGMLGLMPILAYSDLFSKEIKVKKVQANYYKDENGSQKNELYMKLRLPAALVKKISVSAEECYFSAEGNEAILRVPLYEEEMKYFYSDYKDYYYLPIEDVAMHKSIASFVDKDHRVQAKASTCYTRKNSTFLREWNDLYEPYFKRDYASKELFFELTEDMKKDRILFNQYAAHVLQMMLTKLK